LKIGNDSITIWNNGSSRPVVSIKHIDPNECTRNLANKILELHTTLSAAAQMINDLASFSRTVGNMFQNVPAVNSYGIFVHDFYEAPCVELERAP
jgi:hypothetical protein